MGGRRDLFFVRIGGCRGTFLRASTTGAKALDAQGMEVGRLDSSIYVFAMLFR